MKIKDLRIGNLIYEIVDSPKNPSEKELFEVASIDSCTGTLHDGEGTITQIEYCQPITITEDWLLKFGFLKRSSTCFSKGNFLINTSFDVGWRSNWIGLRINNVHQLQNVYFAMTGNELILNYLV